MKIDRELKSDEGSLPDMITRIRDTVRRRWLILVLVAGAIFALGAALTFMMTPQYISAARIQIDPSRDPLQNRQGDSLSLSPEAIETEVSIINSPELARNVVRKLKLDRVPEFTKGLESNGDRPWTQQDRELAVSNVILKRLSVGRDKLTYIIKIEFKSKSAALSAQVANAFADEYLATKLGSNSNVAERQASWYRAQLEQLAASVREADAKVAQYRAASGISETSTNGMKGQTIVEQQIAPLSGQLADAKSQAAAVNATLNAAQSQMARGGRDSVGAVLDSPVVSELRRQRSEVLRSLSENQARYGERHPEMVKAREQLGSLDTQIQEQTNRVINSLSAQATASNARVASLQASMNQLSSRQNSDDRARVLADSLAREAEAKRTQYEKLAALSIEATQKAQNSIGQASIIDRAKAPTRPSSPNVPVFLVLSMVLGLAVGGATIATQEMMVVGIMSKTDVESFLGLPMLAAVPVVRRNPHPADLLIDKPTSLFTEAFRIARASVLGVKRGDRQPHVIAITSALPAEGKTTTALAFARMLAISGGKTLLIECDVRRAVMQEHVRNLPDVPGLIEVLSGEAQIADAIFPGDVDNLSQLLVKKPFFDSINLFGDGRMETLLNELRPHYTHIVLDLPPLIGLADGRFLAALADTAVLIVRWSKTPVTAATTALEWLRGDGVHVAGVMLTMIDPGAEAAGAYYYSKKYSGYYEK